MPQDTMEIYCGTFLWLHSVEVDGRFQKLNQKPSGPALEATEEAVLFLF